MKNFKNIFALVLVLLIFGVWMANPILSKYAGSGLSDMTIGVTVSMLTLIVQYYFRRKEPTDSA